MSRLSKLFEDMLKNKDHYIGGSDGKHFENRISVMLNDLGFGRIIKGDIIKNDTDKKVFGSLKTNVLDKHTKNDMKNPFNRFNQHFIEQPYGKQSYPDFMVLEDDAVKTIEVKYSTSKQPHPIWNSGLPRPNGIYIFGAKEVRDVTFFRGCDVLSVNEIKSLHNFFDNSLKEQQNEYNQSEMSKQKYGFATYVRKAYEQKKLFNKDAILNFFTNENREKLEQSVIDHLRR